MIRPKEENELITSRGIGKASKKAQQLTKINALPPPSDVVDLLHIWHREDPTS